MSRTRIVGGKYTKTVAGDYKLFSKENIVYNSQDKIAFTGVKDGIIYGEPDKISEEASVINTIDVTLNLFFDGTQNNKTNTESREINNINYQKNANKNDDSFENDLTNVARGFDAADPNAEKQVIVYIEGAGTTDKESDTLLPGVSFGEGATGIEAKVAKGCKKSAIDLGKKFGGKDIDTLFVNVYGFSRGATSARHFIHVASKKADYNPPIFGKTYTILPSYNGFNSLNYDEKENYSFNLELENTAFIDKYGYSGACLLEKKMKIKQIKFNFVGLYDSVAAYGIDHRGKKAFGVTLIDNDTEQLKLDSISKARYVFHITAANEYRDNFDLTNINSAKLKGFELTFPGVHSDIGGSYLDGATEISVIDNIEVGGDYKEATETPEQRAINKKELHYDQFRKIVINEGWYDEAQIEKRFFKEIELDPHARFYSNAYQYNYGLVGTRTLGNSYDKVSLKLMIEQSKHHGKVEYLDAQVKEKTTMNPFITNINNQLMGYVNICCDIRNKYVKQYNEDKRDFDLCSQDYLKEIKTVDYLYFMSETDLKQLKKEYLHWSSKTNLIGLSPIDHKPITPGPLTEKERKRNIQDG